jgi:UDP-N-acetylglucosamine:LPS N-acetylglucosamine transferase
MTTIDLIYFNAGGGHRAAARSLEAVIRQQERPWQVRLVNLTTVLDPNGSFRRLTGLEPEDLYNKRLARGWTLGLAQELRLLQGMIRLGHTALVRALQRHWLQTEPDLVVSLVPNFNRALYESLASALPGVPYVTVLTDMADHPPSFWIEPGQDQHLVCGTEKAIAQAQAAGYDHRRLHRSSGMIIHPDFYRPAAADPAAERRRHGLDPARPTGVVLFGGAGSRAMLGIAAQLPQTPLVLMCGHNRALAEQLRRQPAQAPRVVVEFTSEVADYLRLGDFFIGKPGPASLSEAIHLGLPVITVRNALTMPQERYNAQWVREHGVGLVRRSFHQDLAPAVQHLTGHLEAFRSRVARIGNRAVFELPDILARILDDAARPDLPLPLPTLAQAGARGGPRR